MPRKPPYSEKEIKLKLKEYLESTRYNGDLNNKPSLINFSDFVGRSRFWVYDMPEDISHTVTRAIDEAKMQWIEEAGLDNQRSERDYGFLAVMYKCNSGLVQSKMAKRVQLDAKVEATVDMTKVRELADKMDNNDN